MAKRIFITGCNRGLGLEFTRQWLGRGAEVLAACREPESATALNALAAQHVDQLTVIPLDVDDEQQIAELPKRFGIESLDLLINNAGSLVSGERLGNLQADIMRSAFQTNVIGPVLLTQALAPALAAQGGWVVNLSSELGSISRRSGFFTPTYCASKAALNMWTRLLDFALAGQQVRCIALHPGWVQTDMGGDDAPLDPATSVASMISLIDQLGPEQAGAFLSFDGQTLEW
ncbi:MAG: SDR family oxidoreductase [Xanthomonadales bacterium]|nr:SDR family oxidoreductase [Xanthomonadales bacterium]